jgi:hypothetical protein
LAIKLHAGPDDVNVGIVDCTKADDVCAGEAVRGYPTLRFYDGDFHKDYKGVRTLPAIETFVNRALEPSTTAITSMEELVALQAVHSVIFLSFSTAESGAGSDEGAVADPDEVQICFRLCTVLASALVHAIHHPRAESLRVDLSRTQSPPRQ